MFVFEMIINVKFYVEKWLSSKAWICCILIKLLRAGICSLRWWLSCLYVHNINLQMQNFNCLRTKSKRKVNNTSFFGISIMTISTVKNMNTFLSWYLIIVIFTDVSMMSPLSPSFHSTNCLETLALHQTPPFIC